MTIRTQTNNYIRQVTSLSKTCGIYCKPMIEGLKADLESFLDDHPEASEELLLQHFGYPEDYVKEYFSGMSSEELAQKLSAKRFQRKIGISIAAVILAAFVGLCLWIGIVNNQSVAKTYSEKVVVTSTEILH